MQSGDKTHQSLERDLAQRSSVKLADDNVLQYRFRQKKLRCKAIRLRLNLRGFLISPAEMGSGLCEEMVEFMGNGKDLLVEVIRRLSR